MQGTFTRYVLLLVSLEKLVSGYCLVIVTVRLERHFGAGHSVGPGPWPRSWSSGDPFKVVGYYLTIGVLGVGCVIRGFRGGVEHAPRTPHHGPRSAHHAPRTLSKNKEKRIFLNFSVGFIVGTVGHGFD